MLISLIRLGLMLFAGNELIKLARDEEAPKPDETEDDQESAEGERGVNADEANAALATTRAEVEAHGGSVPVAASAFGLSLLGLRYPVARLSSYLLLIANLVPTARVSWSRYKRTGRVDFEGLITIGTVLELALGYVTMSSLGWLIFSIGCALQGRSRRKAEADFQRVFVRRSETAWIVHDDAELEVKIEDIRVTDHVVVHAGDSIPVDGTIVSGLIAVDQRALTGESQLFERGIGEPVLAATVVLSGRAVISPEKTGTETVAARVKALLAQTESYEQSVRGRVEDEAERTVPATAAMIAYGLFSYGPEGLVTGYYTNFVDLAWVSSPFSIMNTIQAAARSSILIKDGRSLEILGVTKPA